MQGLCVLDHALVARRLQCNLGIEYSLRTSFETNFVSVIQTSSINRPQTVNHCYESNR